MNLEGLYLAMRRNVPKAAKAVIFSLCTAIAVAGIGHLLHADAQHVPSNEWAPTGDLDAARAGARATLMYDGRVLVTGGSNEEGVTASAERYSPEAQGFIPAAQMETARANHSATLLPDGKILIAGGLGTDGSALASAEVYDPIANAWQTVAPLNVARSGHTATALY